MILRSFYARLSLLFLILVFILGGASLFIAFNASRHLLDEVEQLLNKDYASSIAQELDAFVGENFSQANIQEAIHYMMVLNPMVEIYLVDANGKILSYFAGGDDRLVRTEIDVKPLVQFTESKGYQTVLGDDPRTERSRKPFSAAKLEINKQEGWVYVILRGQSYEHSLALARSDYYIRSGVFTFLIAVLATLGMGFFLFFLLTTRLRKLSAGVQQFIDGNFSHRIEIGGNDELALLGQAFNEMARSIEEGIAKLKDADQMRSQMIANISHDLRSPLTSIRGNLETVLLKENHITEQQRKEFIETTLRSVSGFQKMVEELLDLAKLEARQIETERMDFSLPELVQDVILKMKGQADEKHIAVSYEPNPNLGLFNGEIGLLERALTNVISNAIEYTPEGGRVMIHLEQEGQQCILTVADTGPGIPSADLSHIFERFYRADKSRTRKAHGTGLGLSIAKEVIEMHGGSIVAANAPEGGAVFTISLPQIV